MFLIVDTETNGLGTLGGPRPPVGRQTTPRMLELAYLLVSGDGRVDHTFSSLIVPDGFRVSEPARAIHGITAERARREGIPSHEAVASFLETAGKARVIVAHNARFDLAVIAGEAERLGLASTALHRPWYCTMRGGVTVSGDRKRPGGPSLSELHIALFGVEPPIRHRAQADAEACARCFFELRRRRLLDRRGLEWLSIPMI